MKQVITDTLTPLVQGTYVFQFTPHSYEEPVSALPLALIFVLATILILGIFCTLYEYIITKK